jgi:dolichyl-phosphate beta-glucosyltransferase
MPPSMSVVVPVLNEEQQIGTILEAATGALRQRGGDWELIVVDNASTDATVARAEPWLGEQVRLLRNEANRGKGYSIRRGMLEARGDLRLMCDADCASSLDSLSRMEEGATRFDVVVGSRASSGARIGRQQPIRRRIVGAGFILLSRVAMGGLPRDVYCGFKLWRAAAAADVFSRVTLDGWAFDAEALALARRLGYTTTEVGIEWTNRADSRLSIRNVLVPVVRELRAARRNVRRVTPPSVVATEPADQRRSGIIVGDSAPR